MKIFPASVWADVQIIGDNYESRTLIDKNAQIMTLLSVLIMYATSLEATANDVDDMDFAYNAYMFLARNMYDRFRIVDGQVEKLGFIWPRLHSVSHYAEWTKKWGVPVHSDTNTSERAHIDSVKVAHRASNKCNTASQLINYSRQADKNQIFGESGNNRCMITMNEIQVSLQQPRLLQLTTCYLLEFGHSSEEVESLDDEKAKWYHSFKLSNRIYQNTPEQTRDDADIIKHVIRATFRYKHGNQDGYCSRFDCVFVHNLNYGPIGKYHNHATFKDRAWHFVLPFTIFRLRGIFTLDIGGTCHELCIGDEFEW
ncbi:BQ5605_C006g04320 [Microbotryum silenes-dioicae]|uniref:BQ5605_C006g04320 protein n=1 Tax=Microbotryum silenes-dioicae TaxID=796604 RepID=A0A2X0N0V2_9BASI|nr:BQ5605_C006g04320 [Microbotryum silenes-dioicae]